MAGAGIASTFLALALARGAGPALEITLVAPAAGAPVPDGRAYALSPGAVAALRGLGAWSAVSATAQPIAGMRITDSRTDDAVRPAYLGLGDERAPALATMVEAGDLAAELRRGCEGAGIAVRQDRVTAFAADPAGTGVRLAGGDTLRAALLVAADGARSRLREAAGIGWVGTGYAQVAIVATIGHERDHRGVAVQHFLPGGPFAILPLAGAGRTFPHRSSIVWSEAEPVARALLAGPEAARLAALAERFGPELGGIALDTPLASYPLAVGLARGMRAARFALLGDAAHQIHPLAGQGLNLGLGDAAALAERIVDAVRLGLDPGSDAVLAAYERDRRFDAVALAGLTDGLNRLFSNDRLAARALRDFGLGLVDRAPALKRALGREAAGTSGRAPRLMRGEAL